MSTQQQKKPYLDTCTVPHYGTVTNDKSIEDGRNKEFVFQSLVVPDLRHIGIKTSLSYPADDEALSYNIKSGLRDAISQAYRRLPPLNDDDKQIRNISKEPETLQQQTPEEPEAITRHGDALAIFQTMLDDLYSPRAK